MSGTAGNVSDPEASVGRAGTGVTTVADGRRATSEAVLCCIDAGPATAAAEVVVAGKIVNEEEP